MNAKAFQLKVKVPESAIDAMDHVNNVKYLQWVQDVAEAHWQDNSTPEMLEKYAWVALEHTIKYHAPAFKDDEIILETWIEKFEGVRSIRRTKIFRQKDDKILSTAVTQWCLLGMPKGRPMRVPDEFTEIYERANQ